MPVAADDLYTLNMALLNVKSLTNLLNGYARAAERDEHTAATVAKGWRVRESLNQTMIALAAAPCPADRKRERAGVLNRAERADDRWMDAV